MATNTEKQELIEDIKRPDRYYRISIHGYGSEIAYVSLTKEQYEFWSKVNESDNNFLNDYVLDPRTTTEENDISDDVNFLKDDNDEDYYYEWYESPNEVDHQSGISLDDAYITIYEVESDDYTASEVASIVDAIEFHTFADLNDFYDNTDYETSDGNEGKYMCQIVSGEKGTYFDGIIKTTGKFDVKKLKFNIVEYMNGDEILESVTYNNEYIDNDGFDTTSKGMSVYFWSNE